MPNTYQISYPAILIIQIFIPSNFLTLYNRKKIGRDYALVSMRIDYNNMLFFFVQSLE